MEDCIKCLTVFAYVKYVKFTPTRRAEQATELGVETWLASTGQRSVASA